MKTPSAPRGDELLMTAMGDALVIGIAHLDEVTAESKVLLLELQRERFHELFGPLSELGDHGVPQHARVSGVAE